MLYPASLKSWVRFERLPDAAGVFSVVPPNGLSYAGLDRESMYSKIIQTKIGGRLGIAVVVPHAWALVSLNEMADCGTRNA